MGKRINIRPTTSVYATYKNIKYNPWTAIAEFVDNSTQSYYDNRSKLCATKYWNGLKVDVIYDKDEDRLIIRDNAYGMNFRDFQRAIVLDSRPKITTRSEFGMGLKTAACWFGSKWSVETTELGSSIKYRAEVDIEALRKYKNEEIEVEEIQVNPKEHGTTITIWNLNRGIRGRQVGKTKDQLRGMYRVDLRSGEIKISYNGEELYYTEPEVLTEKLADGTERQWKKEIGLEIPYKGSNLHVSGFIAIRDTANTSAAGFALLRRGRVIVGGYENAYRPEEIFGKPNTFVYQRLFGELNLDDWPVTQTKDGFDWFNGLEDALIEQLNEVCKEYKTKATKLRKSKKTTVQKGINSLTKKFEGAGIIGNSQIDPIDQPEDLNNSWEDGSTACEEAAGTLQEGDIELEGETGKRISFETRLGSYVFNLFLECNDPFQNWLSITQLENEEYEIKWNIRHPFFKPYINQPDFLEVMEQFVFAFALSEIESRCTSENGRIEPDKIRMKMNEILKSIV